MNTSSNQERQQSMPTLKQAIEQIERVGYCRIPGVYSKARMAEALEKVRSYYDLYKERHSGNVPFLNIDQPTLYNLQNKDMFFLDLLFEPKMLQDVLCHFLNDRWFKQIPQSEPNYVLRSYIARSSNRQMPLHLDSFLPYLGSHVFVVQYSIILQAQNPENGCTVVVPGSHVSGEYANQDAFAEATPIESEVGDVVIWDSRLWHGTTENRSGGTRWAIIGTFCRWWMKQHWNVTSNLPDEFYQKLTDSQRAVLGFCSVPHHTEMEGIDLKCGYEALPEHVNPQPVG